MTASAADAPMADALTVADPLVMGGPSPSVIVFIPVASRQDNSLTLFWRHSEPCPDLPVGQPNDPNRTLAAGLACATRFGMNPA